MIAEIVQLGGGLVHVWGTHLKGTQCYPVFVKGALIGPSHFPIAEHK